MVDTAKLLAQEVPTGVGAVTTSPIEGPSGSALSQPVPQGVPFGVDAVKVLSQ